MNQKCRDPCPGSCGLQTVCQVYQHSAICSCREGYTGNPFQNCAIKENIDPTPSVYDKCNPSPCGSNSDCSDGQCTCRPGYFGNPYLSCRPECTHNSDCAQNLACVNNKCVNPCINICGTNAICDVYNHIPMCSCPSNTTGSAFFSCSSITAPIERKNPCEPSPCGPFSVCRTIREQAMCSCLLGYIGVPPSCRPECLVDSDCTSLMACSNQRCIEPCRGSCGLNSECRIHNHKAICYCRNGYTGDPFTQCLVIQNEPPKTAPCQPSPCGSNSVCRAVGDSPSCTCASGYVGNPPYCRPECVTNAECSYDKACINKKCADPCPGACGRNAECRVISHSPQCLCQPGYQGDSFDQCVPVKVPAAKPLDQLNPCRPNPCGPNAICQERNNAGSCTCLSGYFGNPYEGCRPECLINSDCPENLACMANKCQDPCPGLCGTNAECQTVNHIPKCVCLYGYVGNPYDSCTIREEKPQNPCNPSPCGPYSTCRAVNNQPVCTCFTDFIGNPPNCRPECVTSPECPLNKACVRQKCVDPCVGTCGENAECRVHRHSPYCTCLRGYEGDPFSRCTKEKLNIPAVITPCEPNPCGPYSICRDLGGSHVCSCKLGYVGASPRCGPECTINEDCPSNKACVREKCVDPCLGSCGTNTDCRAMNHLAICTCLNGYRGDPFVSCSIFNELQQTPPVDPCALSPCGINAICNAGTCSCNPGYHGNPAIVCRPECTNDNDCSKQTTCIRKKCVNPCLNACGREAICNVYNHIAICECPAPLQGDPFISCRRVIAPVISDPCVPNPCGPNSICRAAGTVAHCSCRPPMSQDPPSCKPECRTDGECPLDRACRNGKCRDPCPGVCGAHALCQTRQHSPICTCPPNYVGDPFIRCLPALETEPKKATPCSNCGPNANCVNDQCQCRENYLGQPPFCRAECLSSNDCPWHLTCINRRCVDPCPGACGHGARCEPVAHEPRCDCPPSTTGNPLVQCQPINTIQKAPPNDPCNPSPCGPGAICRARGAGASCECEPGLRGDPYSGCRPECLSDSDCAPSRACIRSHCRDPCQGTCGIGAECETVNHIPLCSCPQGTRGNAFERCEIIMQAPPCTPSPCGPGALCTVAGNSAICSCPTGTSGDAATSGCRPECVVSSECPRDRACIRNKCVDPCIGACGNGALCRVFDHAPICSCPPLTTGDPFIDCRAREIQATPPTVFDPCDPNPCGPHGACRDGFCTYPECIVNDDCVGDRACINRKCVDPCVGACGLNAICTGVRHAAVCSCPAGYSGSPFVRCERIAISTPAPPVPECVSDEECADTAACINTRCTPLCAPSNCGLNARCVARQHRAHCACLPGFEGNANTGCYSVQCHSNNDCPDDESCEGGSCVKVCSRVRCGPEAHCVARGHVSTCECDAGARGNPWTGCRRDECTNDEDCNSWLACRSGTCQNPCPGVCAPGALCTVTRHIPTCECPRGTVGNPRVECKAVMDENPNECQTDAECGPELACLQGRCLNPCDDRSCGDRAVCRVANTLPFRTLVCECPKPLTGDASVQCNPKGECSEDSACGDEERCLSGRCAAVCDAGACGVGAECRATAHRASCTCQPPLQGNPNVACTPGLPGAQCTSDSVCGTAEACVARRCVSACAGACGSGALCEANHHRARCNCPPGTAGDPARGCYTPECTSDDNCPFDKSCMNGYCQDPCVLGSPCGREAICETIAHAATCRCPPGTQGDARRACISAVCHYNEDCDDTQICDRLNRVCRPACSDDACAPGALCTAREHRPICSCPPGRSGDAYVRGCTAKEVTSRECTSDSDCRSPLACVNTRCTDLCLENPCDAGLLCRTVDVLPLRAVACICPDGGRVAPDSGCRSPPNAECSSDSDCSNSQTCRRGSCIDTCRADPCGLNSLCESSEHVSKCSCPPGYIGNPRIECNTEPRQPQIWECYMDDECGPERACIDRRCVNPCNGHCGVGALCRVMDHKPICSCPRGYTGEPQIRCTPPSDKSVISVGCKANSDCPLSQACINSACADPCACGLQAECNVVRHHPVCFCREGHSGNPYTGCVKVGCSSNSECSDSDTCYNGACVSPCLVEAPCAVSAECYGKGHRPECRCPVGTNGNPYVKCLAAECEIDTDCNDDSVCMRGVCRNACATDDSQCASNAECFARNHAASCRCPSNLPLGDALTYCERIPVVGEPECRLDSDCGSGQACLRDQCREACDELKPCTGNARCSVSDSIPFRTLICRCPEGFVQDEEGSCKSAQLPPPSCSTDQDCSDQESCINRICRNPCNCGDNAECFIRDHRPVCSCRDGFEGNPYRACRVVGCRSNSECESDEACVNSNCISPCLLNSTCGPNGECYVERNHPLCRCRPGFEGDAYIGCNPIECRSNGDCPHDKQCRAHRCINPCFTGNTCGTNAQCLVRNHIPVCKCDEGFTGSPYIECRPQTPAECYVDADCPSMSACLSARCVNPCTELKPCSTPARCEVSPTLPVRTMLCTCPPGYVSSGGGVCRPALPIAEAACEIDNDCTSNHACITSFCKNPCECGPNADCQIREHKPVCACRPGFLGDARTGCYEITCQSDSQCSDDETCINNRCIPACSAEPNVCGQSAECYGVFHRASCRCKIGTVGNPSIACQPIGCRSNSDCPLDKYCMNSRCIEPCTPSPCNEPAECRVYQHEARCICPPGYQSTEDGCIATTQPECKTDLDCPSGTACLSARCVNPCLETKPCGTNAECTVADSGVVRTMICECSPGYQGNALVECTPHKRPVAECIPGQGVDSNGECVPCRREDGRIVDARGRCVCDIERGYTPRGDTCVPIGCRADSECDDRSRCIEGTCINACEAEPCGVNAACEAVGHRSNCTCIAGYTGNPKVQCNATTPDSNYRTDFPLPDMKVHCLADGVRVSLTIKNFTGVLYVKGYSKDERCRSVVQTPESHESPVDFTVHFGDCGLVHVNGLASFVLVMQKHPKLVTSNAKAFHIKCIYQTGEQNVTLAFNVSMLTTAGTIANTGPPPTCSMRIVTRTGDEVSSAEIGENLVLQVDVRPSSIYGGFARSCIAKTSEISTNVENEYTVTDADGCATDPAIFGDWERSEDGSALRASFNAFKFPSSDNIRFQCNIRVCFGKCQPVNCRGFDAFGKRRKREISDPSLSVNKGQFREEVTVESNQILTLERRDPSRVERQRDSGETQTAGAGSGGEVCVSAAGLAVALALTALLALVAVAAAVACWLVAWRRARPPPAPLPHPPDFPNPMFQR